VSPPGCRAHAESGDGYHSTASPPRRSPSADGLRQVWKAVSESEGEGQREEEREGKQAEKVTFECGHPGGILRDHEGQRSALESRRDTRTRATVCVLWVGHDA